MQTPCADSNVARRTLLVIADVARPPRLSADRDRLREPRLAQRPRPANPPIGQESSTGRPSRVEDASPFADLARGLTRPIRRFFAGILGPAAESQAKHLPYSAACLTDHHGTALTTVSNDEIVGRLIVAHRSVMPPFTEDAEQSWLVDDFYVRSPGLWDSVGGHLLRSLGRIATANADCERLIAVTLGATYLNAQCYVAKDFNWPLVGGSALLSDRPVCPPVSTFA